MIVFICECRCAYTMLIGAIAGFTSIRSASENKVSFNIENAVISLFDALRGAARNRDDFLLQLRVDPMLDTNGMLIDGCIFTLEKMITTT